MFSGKPPLVVAVSFKRPARQELARLPGGGRGNPLGIEGIEVSPGRQNIPSPARHQAGRPRRDKAAVQTVQKRRGFVRSDDIAQKPLQVVFHLFQDLRVGVRDPEISAEAPIQRRSVQDIVPADPRRDLLDLFFESFAEERCFPARNPRNDAAQRIGCIVEAGYGIDERGQLVPFGEAAEDMHSVRNGRVLQKREPVVDLPHPLAEAVVQALVAAVEQLQPLHLVRDQVGDRVRPAGLGPLIAVVLFQEPFQLLQVAVQFAFHHDGLQVIDENRVAPALGDGALRRIIRVVDVEVRHSVDADVGKAPRGHPGGFARQEFKIAVRPHVDQGVGAECFREPLIRGDVLVGRRRVRVVEDPAGPAVAPGARAAALRLDADDGVAAVDAGHHDLPVMDHGGRDAVLFLPGRIPPDPAHAEARLFGKHCEPRSVLLRAD